jgi:hypothetical protein
MVTYHASIQPELIYIKKASGSPYAVGILNMGRLNGGGVNGVMAYSSRIIRVPCSIWTNRNMFWEIFPRLSTFYSALPEYFWP